jgi:hypothetical protein
MVITLETMGVDDGKYYFRSDTHKSQKADKKLIVFTTY